MTRPHVAVTPWAHPVSLQESAVSHGERLPSTAPACLGACRATSDGQRRRGYGDGCSSSPRPIGILRRLPIRTRLTSRGIRTRMWPLGMGCTMVWAPGWHARRGKRRSKRWRSGFPPSMWRARRSSISPVLPSVRSNPCQWPGRKEVGYA